MKPLTKQEQDALRNVTNTVRSCVSALRLVRGVDDLSQNEDLAVAVARLENWLTENDGRWVA